jgi:hypothetical protein
VVNQDSGLDECVDKDLRFSRAVAAQRDTLGDLLQAEEERWVHDSMTLYPAAAPAAELPELGEHGTHAGGLRVL